ncbi:hypothetical protein NWP21_06825 [Anabaenopsis sp. FSS-46]|nr:hypothetical protein [Anabaenopsis sp. FSS-46]MDH6098560.1 hypothetical protein [Anabaenopsis sp. FSS-46]
MPVVWQWVLAIIINNHFRLKLKAIALGLTVQSRRSPNIFLWQK